MSPHERWSTTARRLGITSALGIGIVGALYVAVIGTWLLIEATPREPIADPYLAVMEILTGLSAIALLGLVLAVFLFANDEHRVCALAAVIVGGFASVCTLGVHFVQLTAVRQLWRSGNLRDYRLVWPSVLFAVEYFAWDVLVGLTMLSLSCALAGEARAGWARRAFLLGGVCCLVGIAGPSSGRMAFQNIAVFGYAGFLPIASVLTALIFKRVPPRVLAA